VPPGLHERRCDINLGDVIAQVAVAAFFTAGFLPLVLSGHRRKK
jgi:hypothetical protein